jgi:hypothetical protein
MNANQRKLMIGVGCVVLAMLLYPPYKIVGATGFIRGSGYEWIFNLPYSATVEVLTLLAQWVGVLIGCGIAFFLLRKDENENHH